jgi:DNA-binding HxlR family transcriptional regulator
MTCAMQVTRTAARATPAGAATPPRTPLDAALTRVGDRWTLLVVDALLEGPRRFNDLLEAVSGIAPNVLTARLRHLERERLVVARAYSARPPRHVYELTAAGLELAGALRLLAEWGGRHAPDAEPARHAACGSRLEARWWCPSCERTVDEEEEGEGHFI